MNTNSISKQKRKSFNESWEDISLIWKYNKYKHLARTEQRGGTENKTKVREKERRDCLMSKLKATFGYRNKHPSSFGKSWAVSEKE